MRDKLAKMRGNFDKERCQTWQTCSYIPPLLLCQIWQTACRGGMRMSIGQGLLSAETSRFAFNHSNLQGRDLETFKAETWRDPERLSAETCSTNTCGLYEMLEIKIKRHFCFHPCDSSLRNLRQVNHANYKSNPSLQKTSTSKAAPRAEGHTWLTWVLLGP